MVSKGEEGELHENTIRAMEMSAKSLWELGRKQEGYGKLSEVAGLYEKARGSKHPTTIMIQDLLREWNSKNKFVNNELQYTTTTHSYNNEKGVSLLNISF